ncbi:Proteasome, subunit alpha/beta [Sesbania bispinosa]|nr:Proteasome, subunit alpha/beta [Sesbania bispinosa]
MGSRLWWRIHRRCTASSSTSPTKTRSCSSILTSSSPPVASPVTGFNSTEYIQKNVALYQFRNGIPLTTAAAANFTRGELATALRKRLALHYTILTTLPTLHKLEKGAFGYGSYFSLSMMDRHYHSGMSVEEAIDLVDKCIMEIRSRLVVAPPNFVIKIVDKDGAKDCPLEKFQGSVIIAIDQVVWCKGHERVTRSSTPLAALLSMSVTCSTAEELLPPILVLYLLPVMTCLRASAPRNKIKELPLAPPPTTTPSSLSTDNSVSISVVATTVAVEPSPSIYLFSTLLISLTHFLFHGSVPMIL